MLQIMNQILTQGGFLRAFFQTVILIAAGCALFRADILGPGDKHAITTVVWKLAVPCMAFDAFMSDFNTQEFLSELGVLALSFALYAVLYALGTLLFRRAAGRDAKVCGLFCAVGQLTLFAMPVLQSIYAGTGSTVLISVSVMTISGWSLRPRSPSGRYAPCRQADWPALPRRRWSRSRWASPRRRRPRWGCSASSTAAASGLPRPSAFYRRSCVSPPSRSSTP